MLGLELWTAGDLVFLWNKNRTVSLAWTIFHSLDSQSSPKVGLWLRGLSHEGPGVGIRSQKEETQQTGGLGHAQCWPNWQMWSTGCSWWGAARWSSIVTGWPPTSPQYRWETSWSWANPWFGNFACCGTWAHSSTKAPVTPSNAPPGTCIGCTGCWGQLNPPGGVPEGADFSSMCCMIVLSVLLHYVKCTYVLCSLFLSCVV